MVRYYYYLPLYFQHSYLISDYPSHTQYQKEEETDFDQLQVEEADVRMNVPNLKWS